MACNLIRWWKTLVVGVAAQGACPGQHLIKNEFLRQTTPPWWFHPGTIFCSLKGLLVNRRDRDSVSGVQNYLLSFNVKILRAATLRNQSLGANKGEPIRAETYWGKVGSKTKGIPGTPYVK